MPRPVPTFDASHHPAPSLDAQRIVGTVTRLHRRISERFPEAGLARVAGTLVQIAERTMERLDWAERPNLWLRAATWLRAALVFGGVVAAVWAVALEAPGGFDSVFTLLQVVEAGIQDVIFVGVGLVFLMTVENRLKRKRALRFIRELRALAHIVDMHQLTKDPDRLLQAHADTDSSPGRTFTRQELGRYLDYCSEMLSLTSKLAALYAARFDDSVVLQAVDEVETLTTGLSRKVWQKIMILDAAASRMS